MSPEGEVVFIRGDGDKDDSNAGPAFERTIHAGAIDASKGESWSRESPANDPRRRRTQRRYMALSATLLGLCTGLEAEIVQGIAECLGVAYLSLSDLRGRFASALTYQEKGVAIISALSLIPVDRTLGDRLLMAGFISGLWGRPERWDPG
jgi:hypothetical protein